MSFFSKLALTIGTAASLAAAASPAMANPYYGGGYSGYGNRGGYGGYRQRDNTGAIVAGALLVGGIAAIAASSHHRGYDDRYYRGGYYGGYGGPVYYDGPRGYYRGGYYARPYRYEQRGYGGYYPRYGVGRPYGRRGY